MKTQCIKAVAQVLGREATDEEIATIEQRIAGAMRREARRDPGAWLATPHGERLLAAAKTAGMEVRNAAELKARRDALAVLAMAQRRAAIADFGGDPLDALARTIAFHADAKGSQQSLEYRAHAIEKDAVRQMVGTLSASNPKFFGLIENPDGIRDLVRELHGESTGNAVARDGAAEFRRVAEMLRERFNRAGGNIGHLEDWGMPHHHSQLRVARAGQDAWRAKAGAGTRAAHWLKDAPPPLDFARKTWVADVAQWIDRDRYVHEDGRALSDTELDDLLSQMHTTIATGGLNKLEPGQAGTAMLANRGAEARELHFRDADAFLAYQAKYGERSVYDVLVGHIKGIAHEIAAVETFGPNPDHAFRLLRDEAVQAATLADPARMGAIRKRAVYAENLFNLATGRTLPVASERVARMFDNLRNLLVSNRLGSAALTSITDEGTMMRIAAVNHLPQLQLWRNELKAFNLADQDEARLAHRAGLGLNALMESLNRFGNDTLGSGWTSKMATATLRASGLTAMTEARRRAFGVTMMSALGHVTRGTERLADLDPQDHRILLSKGITDTDFAVWKLADLEEWGDGNSAMLTPDAIYRIPDDALRPLGEPIALRQEAATKLLGAVLEETDMAVVEPGLRERAITKAGIQRGTWSGELARSFWLFKSFPLAMITKHWDRALSEPTGGARARALAALVTSTTVFGMLALQAAALRDGRDPRDMKDVRTWGAAMLKGGALSIFGDYLFDEKSETGHGLVASALGPVFSTAEEALALTWGNLMQSAKGEETDFGAEAVRFAKNNTPGVSALINLWYARAAVDHLILHDLQELLSPGYLERMRSRAEEQFGASYWWEPGGSPFLDETAQDFAPERAPNLEKAVGAEQ